MYLPFSRDLFKVKMKYHFSLFGEEIHSDLAWTDLKTGPDCMQTASEKGK